MSDPDMGTWYYAYDANGNLTSQTDANGDSIVFTYDALNRITAKDYPVGQTDVTYTYDGGTVAEWGTEPSSGNYCRGKLVKIEDASGTTEMAYDELGRVNKLRKKVNKTSGDYTYDFSTTFDALGRKKTVDILNTNDSDDTDEVSYTYNTQGEVEAISSYVHGDIVTNVNYNASSQMTKVEYGNGVYTDYTYDSETLRLLQLVRRKVIIIQSCRIFPMVLTMLAMLLRLRML